MFTAAEDSGKVTPLTLSPAALTSVTYTTPASASPDSTLVSTSVTACSSLTGLIVTPDVSSTFCVAEPQGTSGAQMTTLVPGFARSWNEVTLAGLSGGTAISSVLEAKFAGSPSMALADAALSMLAVSAEANTSAGAPCWICATRSEDPPKLSFTVTPLCSLSKALPMSVNVPVSDAAAKTVSVVCRGSATELSDPQPA